MKQSDNTPPTLMIIDGHAMAYRAHYALANQEMLNADGMPTETIYGFFRMMAKLLQDYRPQYICMVFDPAGKTFRHEMYKPYKENRSPTPEPLKLQIDEIIEIADKLNLHVKRVDKVEADDVIASLVRSVGEEKRGGSSSPPESELESIIVSGDKDLFSLLGDGVKMLRPKKGVSEFIEIDKDWAENELGVKIENIPDMMALTGDSSDNVPGVKGVGPKSAANLINQFGDLDKIYENIEKITSASVKNKLAENRDNAFISKELVTLKKDLDVIKSAQELRLAFDRPFGEKTKIFQERGYPTLYKQWMGLVQEVGEGGLDAFDGDTNQSGETPQIEVNAHMKIILTHEEWIGVEKEISKCKELAVDTETTGLKPMEAELVGISFSWQVKSEYHSVYLPAVFDSKNERHFDYLSVPDGKEALEWARPVLENPAIAKIGQNIKYDYLVLLNHGVKLQNIQFDTMALSFLTDPNIRGHGLDDLCLRHFNHETIKYKELTGVGKKALPLVQVPLENLAAYAAEDAETTARLKPLLYKEVEELGLDKLYKEIDLPLILILAKMEENGICLDLPYLEKLRVEYAAKLDKIEKAIYQAAGREFNINSTKEMQQVLFQELGIVSKKKTGKGALSTDASVLESIKGQHPVVEEILRYRKVVKLLGGYLEPLADYINKKTGRIHTSFSQTIASTGRLASSDPNLQNIPIKGEDGRAIRRAFVAPKGAQLLSLDYSQIELRILAHYSQDERLLKAYRDDEDIHDQAAYYMFAAIFDSENGTWHDKRLVDGDGLGLEEIQQGANQGDIDLEALAKMKQTQEFADLRSQAKILNFSIAYGVTEYGLSKNLGIGQKEAANYIRLYFQNFPGIKRYMEDEIEKVRQSGVSENFFGRKRRLSQIHSKNRFHREAAERLAINTPIQSTAADLIKIAMLEIQKEIEGAGYKSKMLLQIHDELLFETPKEEMESFEKMAREKMENVVKFSAPLKVTGGFGKNWQEAK